MIPSFLFIVTLITLTHAFQTPLQRRTASIGHNRLSTILSFSTLSNSAHRHPKSIIRRTTTKLHSTEKELDNLISSLLNDSTIKSSSSSSSDEYSRYTHQIAIPLSSSTELTSALHTIQTSLVQDCPRLIRACVMPALLRLPLLYVSTADVNSQSGSSSGGLFSANNEADETIKEIVSRAIQNDFNSNTGPIMLPFRGLELQGEDNSVLYAVGHNINDVTKTKEDEEDGVYIVDDWSTNIVVSGYERLETLVKSIRDELESKGFDTYLPQDEPQGNDIFEDETIKALKKITKKWRPRVPFVRLPSDFYNDLNLEEDSSNKHDGEGIGMEEIDAYFTKGLDGISPTFWYEAWAEEDILSAPGVRMRSVQVYRRMISGGGESESSFYELPNGDKGGLDLPTGDAKQMAKEEKERVKEMERMGQVESEAEREWEEGMARLLSEEEETGQGEVDGDYLDNENYSEMDISIETDDVAVDKDAAFSSPWSERDVDTNAAKTTADSILDTMTTEATDDIQSSEVSTSQQSDSTPKRKLPDIQDNPVFQRLWKGEAQLNSQGESTAQSLDGTPTAEQVLPPYPSNEYFTGIWKVVQSPIGPPEEDPSSQSSDNLILRVDGQVMGGPILDMEYQHKAAGGSWKMFQARRKSADNESKAPAQTRLRIKLLIPPDKEQMIVMEGEVTRIEFGGKIPSSSSAYTGSGGILDGMSTAKLLNDDESSNEETGGEQVLYCGGEAWMENVDGSGKRRKLGPFSLTKMKSVDRSQLIYTVPSSRIGLGTVDDEEDESK